MTWVTLFLPSCRKYVISIYNRTVSSAIIDKSGRVISERKIVRVRRTRMIFCSEITSPDLSIIAREGHRLIIC